MPGFIKSYKFVDLSAPIDVRIQALYEELTQDESYDGYDVLGLKQCRFVSADEKTASVVCLPSGGDHYGL
jgi:hypothetical protein